MIRLPFIFLILMSFFIISPGLHPVDAAQKKSLVPQKTVRPSKAVKPAVESVPARKSLPISIALEKRGGKWFVKLNRAPVKVEIYTAKIRLHTFRGKGKTRFDITRLVPKVRKKRITVNAYGTRGIKYSKRFILSGQVSLKSSHAMGRDFRAGSGQRKTLGGKTRKMPLTVKQAFLKKGRVHVALVPTGQMDYKAYSKGAMILRHGKTTKTWPIKKMGSLKKLKTPGSSITFDTEFKLKKPGKIMVAFRFGGAGSGLQRFYFHPKPQGDHEAEYTGNETHSPGSRGTHVSLSLDVIKPDAGDQFPPGMGVGIPVQYSFGTGLTPDHVTIRLVRDMGDFQVELYNGPPQASHLFPRPVETEAWPIHPEEAYRIVVDTDDGRTGSSGLISLNPYRFYLQDPTGGERFYTSADTWQFRWQAEDVFHHIEAVILKGGVEMLRWTPHIDPPDHLLGDTLIITPDQTWHPAGTDYKLKIEGYKIQPGYDTPMLVAVDRSEATFEVIDDWEPPPPAANCYDHSPINIRVPGRFADPWRKGGTYLIEWCLMDEAVTHVNLNLIKDSTGASYVIQANVPNSYESTLSPHSGTGGGSLDWTVPEDMPSGTYSIHIQSTDGAHELTTFYSIMIVDWLEIGTSPARHETWRTGETRTITWNSGGMADQPVTIYLWHWDSTGRYTVAEGVPNTNNFSWLVTSDALPEGVTFWENVYFEIHVGARRADSEFFHIRHIAGPDMTAPDR